MACLCKTKGVILHGLQEAVVSLSETIAEIKNRIETALAPSELTSIITDIHMVLQAIHKIVIHIQQDSSKAQEVIAKTSSNVKILLKHFNVSI